MLWLFIVTTQNPPAVVLHQPRGQGPGEGLGPSQVIVLSMQFKVIQNVMTNYNFESAHVLEIPRLCCAAPALRARTWGGAWTITGIVTFLQFGQ